MAALITIKLIEKDEGCQGNSGFSLQSTIGSLTSGMIIRPPSTLREGKLVLLPLEA
jgi:hypothetical protein